MMRHLITVINSHLDSRGTKVQNYKNTIFYIIFSSEEYHTDDHYILWVSKSNGDCIV